MEPVTGDRLELVDGGRQLGVLGGEGTLAVGGEHERYFVPADVDVGVMVGGLGLEPNPDHEAHRLGEIAELERPVD